MIKAIFNEARSPIVFSGWVVHNDRNNLVIATISENQKKSDKLELPFEVSEAVKKEYKDRLFMFCLSRFGNCDMFMQ
jgi:RNase P/RNase MRP subunit p29